jgi:DNA-directed RNA polymerase subunit RPC12/RpoP
MANEMRDRLVELIRNTRFIKCVFCENNGSCESDYCKAEIIADHLIENGVVVRKRAKWIYATDCYLCSVCAGKRFNLLLGTDAEYCPYCGAKMVFDEKEGAYNG